MHYFSNLFGKELYLFRTDLLSIIRSLNTVFTAIGICHAMMTLCYRGRETLNLTSTSNTNWYAYGIKTPDDGQ
jgi:hypothetical protein